MLSAEPWEPCEGLTATPWELLGCLATCFSHKGQTVRALVKKLRTTVESPPWALGGYMVLQGHTASWQRSCDRTCSDSQASDLVNSRDLADLARPQPWVCPPLSSPPSFPLSLSPSPALPPLPQEAPPACKDLCWAWYPSGSFKDVVPVPGPLPVQGSLLCRWGPDASEVST